MEREIERNKETGLSMIRRRRTRITGPVLSELYDETFSKGRRKGKKKEEKGKK